MIVIEIPSNPNCDAVEMRVFHELEPPRVVTHVRLAREGETIQWYEIVGWTSEGRAHPALAQKIDDSGEGVILLIHGQNAGLRLRPVGSQEPWHTPHPHQWGLPFILTPDAADVRYAS